MAEQKQKHSLSVPRNHPLIGIPVEENGKKMVRYFTEEAQADRETGGVEEALDLAGAWSDLDLDDTLDALDRIRHESKPTPPIKL
jgi:hypothetical protein